ncbi:MAG: Rid family detoxifying hydrolase [Acidobacteriota bacterium]
MRSINAASTAASRTPLAHRRSRRRRPRRTSAATLLATLLMLPLLSGCLSVRAKTVEVREAKPTRTAFTVDGAAAPIAPYSPGIRAGQLVFLSGQIGIDPATRRLAEGGIEAETRQTLANIKALLEAAGLTFDDVVQAQVFLADLEDYAVVNRIYGAVFSGPPPARAAVQVARLPLDARIEIMVTALDRRGGEYDDEDDDR